jgi:hypothetical protein
VQDEVDALAVERSVSACTPALFSVVLKSPVTTTGPPGTSSASRARISSPLRSGTWT